MNDIEYFLEAVYAKLQPEQVYEGHFSHEWKKSNTSWRGLCPWHDSKSGSAFYVKPHNLTWTCPSCEMSGNPLGYLHQTRGGAGIPRGEDFKVVARELSALTGVDYPETKRSPEQQQRIERIEERRSILDSVLASSIGRLWSAEGIQARAYLSAERGLTDAQIKDLRLGLYPVPETILSIVTKNGGDIDKAAELGVLYQGRNEIYSPLTGYIIVPWNDENGRLLSLYGRWPAKAAPGKLPKTKSLKNPTDAKGDGWLKTKSSPLFLDRAIAARKDSVVVVEGLFDAAVLQANGEDRAIAWVAANASAEQVQTLKRRRIKSVSFCLDPDGAGDKGTLAGIRSLTAEGINTFVVPRLPDGVDPDEFVLQQGIESWYKRVDDSVHGLRYAARAIASRHGDKPTDGQLASLLAEAKDYVEALNSPHEVANFFWPEFEGITGADSGDAAPEYDAILDEVEIIEEAEPDEARYDWALKVYAKEKGLRQYGITGEYLQTQVQSRRDRAGVLEVISTEDLMASNDKREWIIGGLIPARTVGISAADGGVGKTTWFYQMIRAIASGFDWNGLPTMKGTVLVVQVDEPRADTNEKLRDSQFHDVPAGTVNWIRRWKFTQTRQLFQIVKELKPNLVLIDSVTAAMAGTDVDMISSRAGDVIYKLRDFAEHAEWPCSFELLHHVNGSGGMRDSRSFRNNASEVRVISRPDGQSDLSKGDYLLDIQKSRAGLEGEYVLHRDDVKFNWEYHGPRNAPSNMALLREFMDERAGQKFSPSQVANGVGSTFEAAQSILEMCRKLCFIESEVKGYTDKDGNPGVFRLYWARPHMVHPEVAEAIAVSAGFTGNNENNDWEEL